MLSAAVRSRKELAARIEASHRAHLPFWERQEVRFVPQLSRWIADGRFLDDPPAVAAAADAPEYTSVEDFRKAEGLV